MDAFFGTQYSQGDVQRQAANRRASRGARVGMQERRASTEAGQSGMDLDLSPTDGQGMGMHDVMIGDSLDDIILQNNHEIQRRRSLPQHQDSDLGNGHDMSTSNMMKFGSNMQGFQFGHPNSQVNNREDHRHSVDHMDLMGGYGNMDSSSGLPVSRGFFPDVQMGNHLDMNTGNYHSLSMDGTGGLLELDQQAMDEMDDQHMGLYSNPYQRLRSGNLPDYPMMNRDDDVHARRMNIVNRSAELIAAMSTNQLSGPESSFQHKSGGTPSLSESTMTPSGLPMLSASPKDEQSLQPAPPPSKKEDFGNIYSTSGFDMLGILMRVATRKNPEINIGAVDLSCAFVVCDVTQNDTPIVYVSDVFERLTGYNKHEVLGRNCRFLQAPDGNVMPGAKRKYVDDDSVIYIKKKLKIFKEAQRSLINYRKGGQPFMNLLTMIPIPWDNPDEVKYYVGFQVDLVEQPGSITSKDVSGLYDVDYSRTTMPSYKLPEVRPPPQDSGHTISRDDVSTILTSFNRDSHSDITKRMWDKVLLENSDDVVHVLSLKGLFLYLSPSCRHVLEYSASELVGTALSSICHPSDIVPVTRELKDTSAGQPLNVVFRVRRKKSGYTWFESHGSLCVEQGKGRKFIVLVGRERPVYALSRLEINAGGGICEGELWTKLSTSGMFLFVSANVKSLLDRQPSELVGTSLQAVMRPESKTEFGRSLEKARTGKRVLFKHEILTKIGRVLQAATNIYPGDAAEGQKPTFLVAQIRLIKPSRVTSHGSSRHTSHMQNSTSPRSSHSSVSEGSHNDAVVTQPGSIGLPIGSQDLALASRNNIFDELKTTRSTSWQFELRQMEKSNRLLAEELASLLATRKKRKRRRGAGLLQRDCANCHATSTPEWRRGPSGQRDLCNSCGLRWAKQVSGSSLHVKQPIQLSGFFDSLE